MHGVVISSCRTLSYRATALQPIVWNAHNCCFQVRFNQRYWVNAEHWQRPNGPVFLFVGGEGELVPETVVYGNLANWVTVFAVICVHMSRRSLTCRWSYVGLYITCLDADIACSYWKSTKKDMSHFCFQKLRNGTFAWTHERLAA